MEDGDSWVFSKVITAEGKSAVDIYNKSLETFTELYGDANEVIKQSDKESGIVIGKGFLLSDIYEWNAWNVAVFKVWRIVKIEARDGRYKITVTIRDIDLEYGPKISEHCLHGDAYKLHDFYPYNNEAYKKFHSGHFSLLQTTCFGAQETIDAFAMKINKKLNEQTKDDW
ncbi:MAG: DUF4468 domain-containing protein [Bacteroidales bacterium]|nr:DUF4468 domain-containing protein [Bacteroidales bacterium]